MPMIIGLFEADAALEQAIDQLRSLGIHDDVIGIIGRVDGVRARVAGDPAFGGALSDEGEAGRLEGVLEGLNIPQAEAQKYMDGFRKGGALLTAQVDDGHLQEADDLICQAGATGTMINSGVWRRSDWARTPGLPEADMEEGFRYGDKEGASTGSAATESGAVVGTDAGPVGVEVGVVPGAAPGSRGGPLIGDVSAPPPEDVEETIDDAERRKRLYDPNP